MIGRTNAVAGGGGAEFITGTLSAISSEVVFPCPKEPYLVVCRKFYSKSFYAMAACGGFTGGSSTSGMGINRNYSSGDPQQFTPSATYSDGYVTMSNLDTEPVARSWTYYIVY